VGDFAKVGTEKAAAKTDKTDIISVDGVGIFTPVVGRSLGTDTLPQVVYATLSISKKGQSPVFIHRGRDGIMVDVQIKLSALWVALMLTYLLGDVLRIYSGDFKAGEFGGGAHIPEYVVGNRNIDVDSDCYGFPVPDVAVSCESLGKHHRSHILLWF
jgi:hypothetical protein